MRRVLVLATGLAVVAGCGGAPGPADPDPGAGAGHAGERLRAWATVLDDGSGPELCVGGVDESLPPQCGGPVLVGWDWARFPGEQEQAGTRWGEYVVTGTYDGERFFLGEPPEPLEGYDGPTPPFADEPDLTTPCPSPEGGWRPVEGTTTTQADLDAAVRRASGLPGYADLWLDQSVNPAADDAPGAEWEQEMNDPARLVLNVRVTGDPAAATTALREVWGGALCVTRALRGDRELAGIRDELGDVDGMLSLSHGHDVVRLHVVHDDGALQRRLDERYGVGVVLVTSALVPVGDLE